MTFKHVWKRCWLATVIQGVSFNIFAAPIANPCGGASPLLNLIDRPTIADSACVVPFRNAMLEAGYEYQKLAHSTAHEQNFPEAEFRLGLPGDNEFVAVLPNYIHQSIAPHTGSNASTLGIKHEIGYTEHWLAAVEALVTLPTGSAGFGDKETGTAFNAMVGYNFNAAFNVSFMFGGSTETQSKLDGGQRFTSFNPDAVFTYTANDKLAFYGEIYGQTKTGPGEGSGFNFDGGFLYLLLPRLSVDLEYGQRISGNLGGFEHYIGTGIGVLF